MAGLFEVPKRATRTDDSALIKKATSKKTASTAVKGGGGLLGKISAIRQLVENNLGKYKEDFITIQDEETLKNYIEHCGEEVAIDTETMGLDPLQDEIVGISIYSPGQKGAYIPINHRSYVTNERSDNQLDLLLIGKYFSQLTDRKIIMFNAVFDIRFLRHSIGVSFDCYWDAYLASRLMNENEEHKGLKKLHRKYVLDGKEDAFSYEEFFKGVTFDLIPINVAYLYAAHDAVITYELYQYQKQFMYYDSTVSSSARNGMNGVSWVFFNIEMPCVKVVADMEDNGVMFDFEVADKLHIKYHNLLDSATATIYSVIDEYARSIADYKLRNVNHKLSDPINVDSPVQVAILLYDILQIPAVDDKNPRGTGEDILRKIDIPFTRALLDYRAIQKLLNTYIDKLPLTVNKKDGRIHCKFNQYGADTGRFSSQDPNLQNIPSHNTDIRQMFKATDGYVLMSADYSQQEPKVMAQLCGDEKMLQAYRDGKDLYAEIASLSFNKPYEQCLEFNPDGTTNKDGKERRSQAKSILLGVLYGRGVPSIAEQLHTTPEKAQKIKDSVFDGFPAIEQFEKDSLIMAEDYGFVTTLWGRKRRFPILRKPDYEFEWANGVAQDVDPLSFDAVEVVDVPAELQNKYLRKLKRAKFGQKKSIYEEANAEGIYVVDNTKQKTDTVRQVVNARIQGSAADMSKLAMILIGNDKQLKDWGFRLLIPVHDELIGECPIKNAKECEERFAFLMSEAAKSRLTIPIKCDVDLMYNWYGEKVDLSTI